MDEIKEYIRLIFWGRDECVNELIDSLELIALKQIDKDSRLKLNPFNYNLKYAIFLKIGKMGPFFSKKH